MIKQNLNRVKENIAQICDKAAIDESKVKLIAVSKRKPLESIMEAVEAGQLLFGENQIKEVSNKNKAYQDLLANDLSKDNTSNTDEEIKWHLIGSLQTNKVKFLSSFCSLFHALDRFDLAEAIQKRMEFEAGSLNCLIQVNISGEDSKSGFDKQKIIEEIKEFERFDRIKIKGLMGMAENSDDKNVIRNNFKNLKDIFEEVKASNSTNNIAMEELSMGMSGDYNIAIEEGSTMVRVGSAIFGERA